MVRGLGFSPSSTRWKRIVLVQFLDRADRNYRNLAVNKLPTHKFNSVTSDNSYYVAKRTL